MVFINPLFLIALATGTVPVIIHFMFRKRAKIVLFPSVVFLRQLDREVIRRRRLQEILIMILRILVLVLFVIFLAKPVLRANLFFGKSAKSVVIIIDNSYSMRAEDDKVLFDKAKERAVSIVDNLRTGDKAAIILTSGTRTDDAGTSSLLSNHEAVKQRAESLRPGFSNANLDLAFEQALELLRNSGEKNTLIFLITDMQRNDWIDLRRSEKENDVPLVIVDVSPDSSHANAAIIDLEISSTPDNIARRIFDFTVKLRNFSSELTDFTLGMYTSSDTLIDDTNVDLGADEEKEVRLVFQAGVEGWQGGFFRISTNDLEVDNSRYYALQVRKKSRVGIFTGEAIRNSIFDQYFFLSRTIDPLDQKYPFSVDRFFEMNSKSLSNFDIVIITTVPDLNNLSFADLTGYILNGGKVLIFVESIFSNERLADLCGTGSEIGSIQKGIYRIGKEIFGLSNLFLDVDVYERVPISLPESSSLYTLASYLDGKPFIVERILGSGKVIVVTTGYNVDMTNLPLRHASVPLLYKLLFRLSEKTEADQYLCGDTLEWNQVWESIAAPDEKIFRSQDLNGEFVLDKPGLYVSRSEEGGDYTVSNIAAANVDASEGDLTEIASDELTSMVPFTTWEQITSNEDIRQKMSEYSRGTPLWDYFLFAAIICFFFELFLANHAGRRV